MPLASRPYLQTMREKLLARRYRTWRGFTADLDTICQNARDYNGQKSIYWKAASSFQRAGAIPKGAEEIAPGTRVWKKKGEKGEGSSYPGPNNPYHILPLTCPISWLEVTNPTLPAPLLAPCAYFI